MRTTNIVKERGETLAEVHSAVMYDFVRVNLPWQNVIFTVAKNDVSIGIL
jgi:hypothetical protein